MTHRSRTGLTLVLILALTTPRAHALFNFNDGTDQIFVTGTYSIGYDTNVFTRAVSKKSFTQSASASIDYSREAGVITMTANLSASAGRFSDVHGQNFNDPSLSVAFRKRYGRTTGSLALGARRESQADLDAGQRTHDTFYNAGLDVRYPVNDRYYFTNFLGYSWKNYVNQPVFSDLSVLTDSLALNYVYTSKLDLNSGYTFSTSDTSKHTRAYDQSLMIGAAGSILPKLSGTVNFGVQRRDSDSITGGHEHFNSFTSGTSVKWLLSQKFSFNGELNEDFSTTSTDLNVNRTSIGFHGTAAISTRYILHSGVTYIYSDYLGKAGAGRRDELFQFDASLGVAFTTHLRTTLAYVYTVNRSNFSAASFTRQMLTLTIVATY